MVETIKLPTRNPSIAYSAARKRSQLRFIGYPENKYIISNNNIHHISLRGKLHLTTIQHQNTMKTLKTLIAASVSLGFASMLQAGLNESATLNASITSGALEIVPASVTGPWAANGGGSVAVTGSVQSDALAFNIDGITINDLNGDGLGWILTAAPAAALTDGTDNLPLGTTGGYNNPSDVANSTVITNQVTYTATAGVVGYTVDYDVAYDVPALVGSGSYTGTVAFVLAAN